MILQRDGSSPESSSELDSGISVNVNYEDPTRWNKRGESNRGSSSPDEEKGRKSGSNAWHYFTRFIITLYKK